LFFKQAWGSAEGIQPFGVAASRCEKKDRYAAIDVT